MDRTCANDEMQLLFTSARTKVAPTACPSSKMIIQAVQQSLSQAETHRIIEHCALCPSCAEEWRVCQGVMDDIVGARKPDELSKIGVMTGWDDLASAGNPANESSVVSTDPIASVHRGGKKRVRFGSSARVSIRAAALAASVGVIWSGVREMVNAEGENKWALEESTIKPQVNVQRGDDSQNLGLRGNRHKFKSLSFSPAERRFNWELNHDLSGSCEVVISDSKLKVIDQIKGGDRSAKMPRKYWGETRADRSFFWQVRCFYRNGRVISSRLVQENSESQEVP